MGKLFQFIAAQPIPLERTSLGRLERWIKHPGHQGWDAKKELPNPPPIDWVVSEANNITALRKSSPGAGLDLNLTSYANTLLNGQKRDAEALAARAGFQYLQMDVDQWFKAICKSELTQEWLEDQSRNGKKIYLVTGIRTLSDIRYKSEHGYKLEAGASLQVPIFTALGLPVPTSLDPSAGVHASMSHVTRFALCMPGQRIFQIQYREVRLSKEDPATLTQKEPRWESVEEFSGSPDDMNKDVETFIVADLLEGANPEEQEKLSKITCEDTDYFFETPDTSK